MDINKIKIVCKDIISICNDIEITNQNIIKELDIINKKIVLEINKGK